MGKPCSPSTTAGPHSSRSRISNTMITTLPMPSRPLRRSMATIFNLTSGNKTLLSGHLEAMPPSHTLSGNRPSSQFLSLDIQMSLQFGLESEKRDHASQASSPTSSIHPHTVSLRVSLSLTDALLY